MISTKLQIHTSNRIAAHLDSHNNLVEKFAKWIYDETADGSIVSEKKCADFISRLKGESVRQNDVKRWISNARKYSEKYLSHFIIRVPTQGWRIAIGNERPRFAGKIVHIHAEWGNRAFNALGALKPNEIDELYKDYLLRIKSNLDKTSSLRRNFHQGWIEYIKKEKERIKENERKLIESK